MQALLAKHSGLHKLVPMLYTRVPDLGIFPITFAIIMATMVNPDVCTLSDSNCKDSKANMSGYLGLWERTTNVSGITTGTRTHPLMYKWLALENISEGGNFNMLANVPKAEAPKVHCPMRTRGHLEKTCSSQSKGILHCSLETGKPVVVNVNVMSSIIPSGMLSGHTLRGCFDEIMI